MMIAPSSSQASSCTPPPPPPPLFFPPFQQYFCAFLLCPLFLSSINSKILRQILKTLFEIVLFEDSGNQWSLSRPTLSLILISEQMFSDIRAQILASQPADQQQRLSLCFDKLMADVTRSLESKNRDKFTQNLTVFKHEFRVK
ncbi:exportin-7-like [Ananas comosus]|uniref:Exportin-7-like n=1 Tax=Ananas comosus TaxID=4615 RepID=A0A6P5GCB4_ANACO|nr:exportin-7-like [Ananas comosus]